MSLADIQKRRLTLAYELAQALSFEVCIHAQRNYHKLERLRAASEWARKTYSFEPLADANTDSLLLKDLQELNRRGWIYLSTVSYKTKYGGTAFCLEPDKWSVGLEQPGVDAIEEFLKPWWKRAYEKEPVTAWQVVITLVLAVATFCGGYLVGRHESATPPEKQLTAPKEPRP